MVYRLCIMYFLNSNSTVCLLPFRTGGPFLIFWQMFFMSKRVEIAIDVCYNGKNNAFGEENCLRDKNFYSSLIAERCEYCRSARPIMGGKEIVCKYKGICSPFDRCRSYKYDPLKREPVIGDIGRNFDPDDLKL